jgi:hypothetical protein
MSPVFAVSYVSGTTLVQALPQTSTKREKNGEKQRNLRGSVVHRRPDLEVDTRFMYGVTFGVTRFGKNELPRNWRSTY